MLYKFNGFYDSGSMRTHIQIPTLVRIKPGALGRVGIYVRREEMERVVVFHSEGLPSDLLKGLSEGLEAEKVSVLHRCAVDDASFEQAQSLFAKIPKGTEAVVGFGGGKALDVAKYIAFLSDLPYLSVPTSLSNDGICSPQSSLTLEGRRQSLPSVMPFGVVIDTEVCLAAPDNLWFSGIGDLVAKLTATYDWKLAFHETGTPVDDFAANLVQIQLGISSGLRPTTGKLDQRGFRYAAAACMTGKQIGQQPGCQVNRHREALFFAVQNEA